MRRSFQHQRPGSLVLETLIALALLSVVIGLAASMSGAMMRHRQRIEQHRVSLEAKSNVMTFALATPFAELSQEQLLAFSQGITLGRNPANWQITVEEVAMEGISADVNAKKISVDLQRRVASSSLPSRPLVAWRYPNDEGNRSRTCACVGDSRGSGTVFSVAATFRIGTLQAEKSEPDPVVVNAY